MNLTANPKKTLVISDSYSLSRIVEMGLKSSDEYWQKGVEIIRMFPNEIRTEGRLAQTKNIELIVVALSSSESEAIQMLNRAGMTEKIGRVPMLIISHHPFQTRPDEPIWHLKMPFSIDGFHNKISTILKNEYEEVDVA